MLVRAALVAGVMVAGVVGLAAQESMPGMDMGPQGGAKRQQPAAPTVRPPQAPSASSPRGSSSQSTEAKRGKQPADPMPMDMQGMGMDGGDAKAKAAAASEQRSVGQQRVQVGVVPGQGSDQRSVTVPIQQVQEPEATGFRTGGDLPTPELLKGIAGETPRTLESFLDAAEKVNPTLTEATEDVDRSRGQARQVGLPPDPTVGYSGDHIRGGSYHGGEEGAFVSQEIVLGRKLALRRAVYQAEGRANELVVEVQRARVRNDVTRTFFDALAAQETAVVRDRLLKVALDGETNAHELERVGQADASDVLTAEVAAEKAKVEFEEAQRTFLARYAQLAAYAGQRGGTVHPLEGELVSPPEMDAEGGVAREVVESPAVAEAKAEVLTAEARVRAAKREAVPDLTVKAGEWYSGETLGATNIKAGWESFAEAGVQLPLWNRNQGNVAAAEAELRRAEREVERTELWTRKETEPYAQQYAAARFRAERYRTEMLPRARRAYQLEVTKYQQMAEVYPRVLAAQTMLFALQLDYVEALRGEWDAALQLQYAGLTEGLGRPMGVGSDTTMLNRPTGGSE